MLKPDKNKITYLIFFLSILVLFFAGGGLLVTILEESVQSATALITILGAVVAAAFLSALLCSRSLLKSGSGSKESTVQSKNIVFCLILFILIVTSTLVLFNVAASFYAVSWPMSGLHGVSSEVGKKAWEYHEKAEGFVKVNSWGQRDREHTIIPQPGTYRMIFIGDSFLEDGAPVPLPFRTEEILRGMGRNSYELINLGVSATVTDEYFFRLKMVGLPLQPNHCVWFFSTGSNFIQEPSLLSYGGISSTYPRLSFLQILGLKSFDQVISNGRRPILRSWFYGESLLNHELELKEIFAKTSDDQETEEAYLSFFPPNEQAQLKSVLYKSSATVRSKFYNMLRHPDNGKFRSYYLDIATKIAKGAPTSNLVPIEYSYAWVKAAYNLCRKNGAKFTLVVIPEGFTVDSRMSDQYLAVADMNSFMKTKDDAATRLVSCAAKEGIDVVDLRELLKRYPGSYLDMDGHWSQLGVNVVAEFLANKFREQSAGGVPNGK